MARLSPPRAARIIAEASAALASAHTAGVAHMCLSPGSVRWSQTGEVKVVGLGLDAALSGVTSDEPVITDTIGLGRLLYAALTAHWPGPDYPTLPPAPVSGDKLCSPRQVVAGVPIALSDLAVRAMQLRSGPDSQPLTSPGELARALIAAMPPAPPPAAHPARRDPPPRYVEQPGQRQARRDEPRPARRARRSSQMEAAWAGAADLRGDTWPPVGEDQTGGLAQPSRRHAATDGTGGRRRAPSRMPFGVSRGVVIAAAGLVAIIAIAAFTFWPGSGGPAALNHPGGKPHSSSSVTVLTPTAATGFDPLSTPQQDPSNEQTPLAHFAIDNNPRTAWMSQWYRTPTFGDLKAGSGLMINMGKPVRYSSVTVTFDSVPGANVELLVGTSSVRSKANLDSMTTVASATSPTNTYTFHITSQAAGQYLVIWFTRLPPAPHSTGKYQAEVFNVIVRGTAA